MNKLTSINKTYNDPTWFEFLFWLIYFNESILNNIQINICYWYFMIVYKV